MKLIVARHGETTWNVEKRILGSTPGELTEKGKEQAKLLADNVGKLSLSRGIVSDLKRAVETAEIVHINCPELLFTKSELLRERNFGDMEGKLLAEVDWKEFWSLPPNISEYNAESLSDFTARIATFIKKLQIDSDRPILLITHIGVMNRLNFLSNPEAFEFINYPNAEATEFDLDVLRQNSELLLEGSLTVR